LVKRGVVSKEIGQTLRMGRKLKTYTESVVGYTKVDPDGDKYYQFATVPKTWIIEDPVEGPMAYWNEDPVIRNLVTTHGTDVRSNLFGGKFHPIKRMPVGDESGTGKCGC